MPDIVKAVLSVIFSIAALAIFACLYGYEIWSAIRRRTSATTPINDARSYVATGVSGLVTAIVATALSLPAPRTPETTQGTVQNNTSNASIAVSSIAPTTNTSPIARLKVDAPTTFQAGGDDSDSFQKMQIQDQQITTGPPRSLTAYLWDLGKTVAGKASATALKVILAIIYVVVYVVIGFAAVIVWVTRDASSLIKNQALVFFGMMLAVAKAFIA